MPITSDILPNGLDRADGGSHPGTATPALSVQTRPAAGGSSYFEEADFSPEIERGEQCTIRHTFTCDWTTGTTLIQTLGRGTIMNDDSGNVTRVLTAALTRERGDKGKLIVTAEALSFDNPPDEFDIEDIELNPEIQKHPAYVSIMGDGVDVFPYNTDIDGNPVNASISTGAQILSACRKAADAASQGQQDEFLTRLTSTTLIPDPVVYAAATALYQRFLKEEATFYMTGFKVIWAQYFWLPQGVDAGGYIQDPVTEGGLPEYFWSEDQTSSGQSIFSLSGLNNPTIYTNGLSWLRVADRLTYQRTWFKLTRTWLGGPLGQWDKAIYPEFTP